MTESLPATAVVRVSRGSFDPSRFAEVDAAEQEGLGVPDPGHQATAGAHSLVRGRLAGGLDRHMSASGTPTNMRRRWTG